MARRRGGLPTWEGIHGRAKGRCRECGGKVSPPRRSWCSDECVNAHALRTDPNVQKVSVFERDRGVCQECGRDCVALRAQLQPLLSFGYNAVTIMGLVEKGYDGKIPGWWREKYGDERAGKIETAVKLVTDLGLLNQIGTREVFWDMDHVVPLWEGGTNEISNLRTLCIPCHREETRTGATRRASQRRQA